MRQTEADLHLHLDGSLSMDVVGTLAERIGYDLEGKDLKRSLYVRDNCANPAEYLDYSDLPGILPQTEDALELASCDLVKHLATQGLVYAEIRSAPQLHRRKGLTQEQVVEIVVRGVQVGSRESGMYTRTLLYAMVNGSDGGNEETLELPRAYLGKGVVGADIAGLEGLVPMKYFEGMPRRIYRADVPFTIHAGECGDYRSVVLVVSYGVRCIGHGYAAICSEACMDLLKRENITLEMYIVNSLQTKVTENTEAHPLEEFYARGIRVTYNADSVMMLGTDLKREAALITGRMELTQKDLIRMNEMAAEARLTRAEVREETLRRVRERSGIRRQERDNLDECLDESLEEYRVW